MKPHSVTRRTAALPPPFPSLPTEIWLEICGYLSYGELVAVIGRLSRYHRELLVNPSLDRQLFREAISKEIKTYRIDRFGVKFLLTHPLLDEVDWKIGQHGFFLIDFESTSVLALQLPALSEHATLPPVASLFIDLYVSAVSYAPEHRSTINRASGVTVGDVLEALDRLLSAPTLAEVCDDCSGYHTRLAAPQRRDIFIFGTEGTLTFDPSANVAGLQHACLFMGPKLWKEPTPWSFDIASSP